mmetsp:Transcript_12201/g.23775  ORF Transcript_12201/g.23775 Transcript_12201/m.23775 type:complete len:83 (+) Transcript_12201:580-828(+)
MNDYVAMLYALAYAEASHQLFEEELDLKKLKAHGSLEAKHSAIKVFSHPLRTRQVCQEYKTNSIVRNLEMVRSKLTQLKKVY